jgi:carbon storage regulator CsrA
MLVLTRRNGESVYISPKIEVKVLSIGRSAVKLGFSAPPQINIRRRELNAAGKCRVLCEENSRAAFPVCD